MAPTLADVNWLLSALAQATAALIAIVGGLLVSRYVALHAEQQSASRRVQDLTRREQEADASLAKSRTDLARYRVVDALDDDRVFDEVSARGLETTVDGVLRAIEWDDEELDPDLLSEELEAVRLEMTEAITVIHPLVPTSFNHESWSDFRRANSIVPVRRRLWEWVYEKVCEERRDEAETNASRSSNIFGSSMGRLMAAGAYSAITPAALSAARWSVQSQLEMAKERELADRVAEREAEIRALRQERRLAEETYDATRQPEGFGLALQVLTFLATVGMGVPFIVMGFAPLTLPDWGRVTVIGLFFVGVSMLLRFLFVYAAFLREGGRDTLPKSILGLLR